MSSTTNTIEFDAALFRAQFVGQFTNPPYTDSLLETYWSIGTCYVSDSDTQLFLSTACRRVALNFITAHLLTLNIAANTGSADTLPQTAFVESSSIDKISVSVQSFTNQDQYEWWLNQTPYGQQLLALLAASAVGGAYFGGVNELGSFRRAAGQFIPPS